MRSRRIHPDVERVLISEARIHRRVAELAREITDAYLNTELSIVGVLNGSIVFLGELLHRLPIPTRLDSVVASSYRAGTVSRLTALAWSAGFPVVGLAPPSFVGLAVCPSNTTPA